MSVESKKSYHHGDLRNILIAAAVQLLAQEGVPGLSLRAVARLAGVSHTAPYRHFRNKQALLEALAVQGYQQLVAGCRDAMQAWPNDPVRQWTEAFLTYLHFVIDQPEVARLMFSGVLKMETSGSELQEASDQAIGGLIRIVGNGREAGVFRGQDTDALTLTSWAAVHGLAILIAGGAFAVLPSEPDAVDRFAGQVANTLLTGMLSPGIKVDFPGIDGAKPD